MSIISIISLIALAFIQNVSFTLVSRARNRDHTLSHIAASIFSNGIWFATMGVLVKNDMTIYLFIPYLLGTVPGSLFGAKVAMKIEKFTGAKT